MICHLRPGKKSVYDLDDRVHIMIPPYRRCQSHGSRSFRCHGWSPQHCGPQDLARSQDQKALVLVRLCLHAEVLNSGAKIQRSEQGPLDGGAPTARSEATRHWLISFAASNFLERADTRWQGTSGPEYLGKTARCRCFCLLPGAEGLFPEHLTLFFLFSLFRRYENSNQDFTLGTIS